MAEAMRLWDSDWEPIHNIYGNIYAVTITEFVLIDRTSGHFYVFSSTCSSFFLRRDVR